LTLSGVAHGISPLFILGRDLQKVPMRITLVLGGLRVELLFLTAPISS